MADAVQANPILDLQSDVHESAGPAPVQTGNETYQNGGGGGGGGSGGSVGSGGGGGGGGGGPPMSQKRPDPSGRDSDVCRDFLNGICSRGNRCRYRHPEDAAPNQQGNVPYTFCIDFQNRGCFRESCRFVHATSEDAEQYQRKGVVSLSLARAIAATLTINDSINGIPICKEFQTGTCSRGGARCRYWHVNVDEERAARAHLVRMGGMMPPPPMGGMAPPPYGMPRGRGGPPPHSMGDYDYDQPPAKRPYPGPPGAEGFSGLRGRIPPPTHLAGAPPMGMGGAPASGPDPAYVASIERRNAELEKENEALRRELDREKHRYEDLMALFKTSQGHPAPPMGAVPPPHGGGGGGGHVPGAPPSYNNWGHHDPNAGWS